MNKNHFLLMSVLLAFVSGSAYSATSPENYVMTGPSVKAAVFSEELRDYKYVPLLNVRKIRVSLYKGIACPGFREKGPESGYMYTAVLTKKEWKQEIDIPLEDVIYVQLENSYDASGGGRTCISHFKFNPKQDRTYALDLKLQRTGFACEAPYELRSGGGDADLDLDPTIERATYNKRKIDEAFCSNP